jgi:YbbR domain-containing protein
VVGRISSSPPTVQVVGPESRLRQIAQATTEPVPIAGARERVRDVVNVGVEDSSVRLKEAQNAEVFVEIWPAPVERDVGGVPIRWRNLGGGLKAPQVVPSLARISVRGRSAALANIRSDTIEAFVDLAGLGPGRYNLRVQVDPSHDFGISAIMPPVVTVVIP